MILKNKKLMALIIANFIYCFAVYITLPFLGLYFKDVVKINSFIIGLILGAGPLTGAFLGMIGGNIADRIGYVVSIVIGVCIIILCYTGFIFFKIEFYLIAIGAILGLSRCFIDPAYKALLSINSNDDENKSVFRLRYITICAGAITGPLLGMFLYNINKQLILVVSIGLFFIYGMTMIILKKYIIPASNTMPVKTSLIKQYLTVIKDKYLIILVLCGTLVFISFSQFESIYPLALKEYIHNPEIIFPVLLILNSISGIIFQVPSTFINKKIKTSNIIILGILFFIFSFIIFSIAKGNLVVLITATIIFTVGETLTLPGIEILIDRIAPAGRKASYFGFADLRQLGFFLGPALGGYILNKTNSYLMFISAAVIISVSIVLMVLYKRMIMVLRN